MFPVILSCLYKTYCHFPLSEYKLLDMPLSATINMASLKTSSESDNQILSITAAQCVELSLSNVSNWMGDHQRKHCVQFQARKLEEY